MEIERRMGGCTIEYRADEESCEVCLLSEVEPVWDLGSVRIGGPGRSPVAGHEGKRDVR